MNEIITKSLKGINIESFYINRLDEPTNDVYVVFSHFSYPDVYADNSRGGYMYKILINLYCKKNIESTKKIVIDTLNEAGLKGGICQRTLREETGYYNTAIEFNYFCIG